MKRVVLIIPCLLWGILSLDAQQTDSIPNTVEESVVTSDSLSKGKAPKDNWFTQGYPDPKKAAIMSLAIPGGGQIYNKRWWKLPLVYGAIIGMGFTIDYNQSNYRRLRDALELKRDGEPHEFSGTTIDSERSLRSLRDQFDKNTQMAYVGMFLVYVLQAMEAYVDAHLKTFDVSDDLSLRLQPKIEPTPWGTPVMGVGVSIPIGNASNKHQAVAR